jgi:acylphosphatase
MKSNVKIIVKGRVQGVGYRYFTAKEAKKFDIKGYVINLLNGDVEVNAEGEDMQLIKFVNSLKCGPAFSQVTGIHTEYNELMHHFKEFKVKH